MEVTVNKRRRNQVACGVDGAAGLGICGGADLLDAIALDCDIDPLLPVGQCGIADQQIDHGKPPGDLSLTKLDSAKLYIEKYHRVLHKSNI